MATDTKTRPVVVSPAADSNGEAKARVSHFRAQSLVVRWHEGITDRLDLVPLLTSWAEKNGHMVQVRDLTRGDKVTGQSVRIGGTVREGAQLMTKATRDLIKAAGFTPDQIAEIIAQAAAKASNRA